MYNIGAQVSPELKEKIIKVLVPLHFEGCRLAEVTVGRAVLELDLNKSLMNGIGITHGGMLFTLMDMCAGTCVRSLGVKSVTLQSSINYIRATSTGTLIAESEVLHAGKSTIVVNVKTFTEERKLVADANFTMFLID